MTQGVPLDWSLGNDCRANFGRYALDPALEVLVKDRASLQWNVFGIWETGKTMEKTSSKPVYRLLWHFIFKIRLNSLDKESECQPPPASLCKMQWDEHQNVAAGLQLKPHIHKCFACTFSSESLPGDPQRASCPLPFEHWSRQRILLLDSRMSKHEPSCRRERRFEITTPVHV